MITTLKKIATRFAEHQILWGLGGSWVLKKNGFSVVPHDIDLFCTVADVESADAILLTLGTRIPPSEKDPRYQTGTFYEYQIDGVDVDLMCEFSILYRGEAILYPFDASSIAEIEVLDGCALPYTSLEEWYVLYRLMNRKKDHIGAIRSHLMQSGIRHPQLLDRLLQRIPEPLYGEIRHELNLQ